MLSLVLEATPKWRGAGVGVRKRKGEKEGGRGEEREKALRNLEV